MTIFNENRKKKEKEQYYVNSIYMDMSYKKL